MMIFQRYIIPMFLLIVGIYISAGGYAGSKAIENVSIVSVPQRDTNLAEGDNVIRYKYKGLVFSDKQNLIKFQTESDFNKLIPWVFDIPHAIIPIFASLSFGFLGGAAFIVHHLAKNGNDATIRTVLYKPLCGSVIGVILFFVSFIIPTVFASGDSIQRTETMCSISLIGGFYQDTTIDWLGRIIKKYLSNEIAVNVVKPYGGCYAV